MKIKKIKKIENMAVFGAFDWDKHVIDTGGKVLCFNDVNILYGRNYSGKTTISRIFRAFETGDISDKYKSPDFELVDSDDTTYDLSDIAQGRLNVRVFNKDFIEENLRFVSDPDKDVNGFAILGKDNTKIEEEVGELEEQLGGAIEGKETGLRKKLVEASEEASLARIKLEGKKRKLVSSLDKKATDRKTGIKYNLKQFGDQNYNISKLKADIDTVLKDDYSHLGSDELKVLNASVNEEALPYITRSFIAPSYDLDVYISKVKKIIEEDVTKAAKIDVLVKSPEAHNWAKEGLEIHKEDHENCLFCDNKIAEERVNELLMHFDEDSKDLEERLTNLIRQISSHIAQNESSLVIDKTSFYSIYQDQITEVEKVYGEELSGYVDSCTKLVKMLETKKKDIFTKVEFSEPDNNSSELVDLWNRLEAIRGDSNDHASGLDKAKKGTYQKLRLNEVYKYVDTIGYAQALEDIKALKSDLSVLIKKEAVASDEIKRILGEITKKRGMLKDESLGARKANSYLEEVLGSDRLSFVVDEGSEGGEGGTHVRFLIMRDEGVAYQLSEGEISLLAFCYFLARLDDIETHETKPIIWIDDPISSLDGNHIFFIYSLLAVEIVEGRKFSQLFISTHNLEFLRYLKRLPSHLPDGKGGTMQIEKRYLVVERLGNDSFLRTMPQYMKEYVTEFNYLFEQIYTCAAAESVTDANYTVFYNFPNNARKFLELYLYYKYPDGEEDKGNSRFDKFFGAGNSPKILVTRINNEYSHLAGLFERGETLVEEPEMKKVADLICRTIRKKDKSQYDSLIKSIGRDDYLEESE